MKWNKQGRIYVPDGRRWWAQNYAFTYCGTGVQASTGSTINVGDT